MVDVLVINAGSSSIKAAVFSDGMTLRLSASVSEIGGAATLRIRSTTEPVEAADHGAALSQLLAAFATQGMRLADLAAAGHRVVHGGQTLIRPELINPNIERAIEACIPLAPLHNPHNLSAIRALATLVPGLPQVACFDTGFHATNPEVARRYAIPAAEDAAGIRRYGFHGISYESLVDHLPALIGAPLPARLLALHLGNGASLCAIRDGRSAATTMGYSPLDGLTMGTRAGSIDGNAVLRLAEQHGIDGAARILNRESGLLALGGASDMRSLAGAGTDDARFAIAHFCYWVVRHSGSMIAAMGGLDAVAFTGGIGENDAAVRAEILAGLGWAGLAADAAANRAGAPRLHAEGSRVRAWIVPAEEERHIAAAALRCLGSS